MKKILICNIFFILICLCGCRTVYSDTTQQLFDTVYVTSHDTTIVNKIDNKVIRDTCYFYQRDSIFVNNYVDTDGTKVRDTYKYFYNTYYRTLYDTVRLANDSIINRSNDSVQIKYKYITNVKTVKEKVTIFEKVKYGILWSLFMVAVVGIVYLIYKYRTRLKYFAKNIFTIFKKWIIIKYIKLIKWIKKI